jgi:hypothetical protein
MVAGNPLGTQQTPPDHLEAATAAIHRTQWQDRSRRLVLTGASKIKIRRYRYRDTKSRAPWITQAVTP